MPGYRRVLEPDIVEDESARFQTIVRTFKMRFFLFVGILLLSSALAEAHWPGMRMKRHIPEAERVSIIRGLPSGLLQDILSQIGRYNKDNRETLPGDEQSRYFGEILDEYRQKYGYPRPDERIH
uniref:Pro-neuropeptide Y n=1 Tax=Steinernema glaseri TaxID=37863 RepID=A0A1I7ZDN8_9BILA